MEEFIVLIYLASGVISLILLIKTFVLFSDVKKIRKRFDGQGSEKEFWIEKNLGNTDKAYDILMRMYLAEQYDKNSMADYLSDDRKNMYKKKFEAIGKMPPDFSKFEKE